MAAGFLNYFDPLLEVLSAGTNPAVSVNPNAVKVMSEIGIDIGSANPKDIKTFLEQSFDYVITVCDNAKETCPVFIGDVKKQIHLGFEDPADAIGTEEEILNVFRKVRDEIKSEFFSFYRNSLKRNNE